MHAEGFHELLRQAQAGDRQAVDQLLAAIRPDLERLARPYADPGRPDESASDLVQSVLLRAWQNIEQFHGGSGDDETFAMFQGWIAQIAHRLGLNAVRDRKAPLFGGGVCLLKHLPFAACTKVRIGRSRRRERHKTDDRWV